MQYTVRCVVEIEVKAERRTKTTDAAGDLEAHVGDAMRELEHRWILESTVELDLARSEATFAVIDRKSVV